MLTEMMVGMVAMIASGKSISLHDDIMFGTTRMYRINEQRPAIEFALPNGLVFGLEGDWAQLWMQLHSENRSLGGVFIHSPCVILKAVNNKTKHSVVRFAQGCMFCSDGHEPTIILDWEAVKQWEQRGGYNKVGMPTKTNFRKHIKPKEVAKVN